MKKYALRKTSMGFQLCEVFQINDCEGVMRNYCHTFNLIYKKEGFAKDKADYFFTQCYPKQDLEFVGVIQNNEYNGEAA